MAKKEVLFSTCDRCGIETQTDMDKKPGRPDKFALPPTWLHVEANTRSSTVFEIDLCEECKQPVIEAAGRAG